MGKCEKCGKDIDDKYKYCLDCLNKIKNANKSVDNEELLTALGQINNNLYYLRRALEIVLREKYACKLDWVKKGKKGEKGDFKEISLPSKGVQ